MNPLLMGLIIVSLHTTFAVSAVRRWGLLLVGGPTHENRFTGLRARISEMVRIAFLQKKLRYYIVAGLAHQVIFTGFCVLTIRTLILWGRGFFPEWNLLVLGPEPFLGLPLGDIYNFAKDISALMVLSGVSVFIYFRTVDKQPRMAQSLEGRLIVVMIGSMMLADIFYDGAITVIAHNYTNWCSIDNEWCGAAKELIAPLAVVAGDVAWHAYPEPAGSAAAVGLQGLGLQALVFIAHAGFWTHSTLVLVLLNLLPHSKHFHIITAIPNVFLSDQTHPGRLRPIAKDTEALMELVEKASEGEDISDAPIGYARIEHFTWKDVLDFYTCTECGRCSDNCPANITGKKLSPKHLTLDLRDHLYSRQTEFLALDGGVPRWDPEAVTDEDEDESSDDSESSDEKKGYQGQDLLPDVIDPDVIWACTSCRACEEQCPVNITYVDKIIQMRRNQVVVHGEFPAELNKPFEGMETNGNPWNLSRMDRTNWAEGLDIPVFANNPEAEVLYWVGCAASYDDRAKKIARATATLLKQAGINFAILADEESCTGDPARRAGNEYLFTMLAEANAEVLNGYKEQGGIKKILTTCPHCFNTLANEYPDFGAQFEVVHHTDFLLGLVAEKKLVPTEPVKGKVTYHDSCYLGRYNDIYDSPREILKAIPGVELVEPDKWSRNKGLCCGAGGAQMFMEEQNKDRVNIKRTKQLLDTGATTIASACPFCMTMLTDGIKAEEKEESIKQMDVVELLALSCGTEAAASADAPAS